MVLKTLIIYKDMKGKNMYYYKLDTENNIIERTQDVKDYKSNIQLTKDLEYYGVYRYYLDNNTIVERNQAEIDSLLTDEQRFRAQNDTFEKEFLDDAITKWIDAYGTWGSMIDGLLIERTNRMIANLTSRSLNEVDSYVQWRNELREYTDFNYITIDNFKYSDSFLDQREKGFIYVNDTKNNSAISIQTSATGDIIGIASKGVIAEVGYDVLSGDVVIWGQRGGGNIIPLTPFGKPPLTVLGYLDFRNEPQGNIVIGFELKTNSNVVNKAFVVDIVLAGE